jgi:hypothetical protein
MREPAQINADQDQRTQGDGGEDDGKNQQNPPGQHRCLVCARAPAEAGSASLIASPYSGVAGRFIEVSAMNITRFAGCGDVGWSGILGARD